MFSFLPRVLLAAANNCNSAFPLNAGVFVKNNFLLAQHNAGAVAFVIYDNVVFCFFLFTFLGTTFGKLF